MKNVSLLAKLALFTATIIWGTTFFIMESTIEMIEIFTLLSFRFIVAGVLLGAILYKKLKLIDKGYLIRGFILGFLVIIAYVFQTYGLKDEGTTPGKNAFLTAIYCIIVPFVYWAITKTKPDRYNISAALLCLLGVSLISTNGNDFQSVCMGDILTLLGGAFFAFHVVAVAIFSKNRDVLLLTMLQLIMAGIMALIPALTLEKLPTHIPAQASFSIIYLTVMATCLCYILQNAGQKYTSPSSAALILSLEAVFGVLFSVIFTEETLSLRLVSGFIIIFLAIIISEVKPRIGYNKK